MSRMFYKRTLLLTAALSVAFIAACSPNRAWMDVDTFMAMKRARLEASPYAAEVAPEVLDLNGLFQLSEHYKKYGTGPVDVTVTYDPQSKVNTAVKAADTAADIANHFKQFGTTNIKTDILPIPGEEKSRVMISYNQIKALPPDGCDTLPGLNGRQTEIDFDYGMGCTIETLLAKQVASPKDLAGRQGLEVGSGRRAANIVVIYHTGEKLQELDGETASE